MQVEELLEAGQAKLQEALVLVPNNAAMDLVGQTWGADDVLVRSQVSTNSLPVVDMHSVRGCVG